MFSLSIKKISGLFFDILIICCFVCEVSAHNYCINVGIIGGFGCGKTTLMNTYLKFDNRYPPHSTNLGFHQFNLQVDNDTFLVTFWDTPGDTRYTGPVVSFIGRLDIVVLAFDAYELASCHYSEAAKDRLIRNWLTSFDNHKCDHAKIILFGMKTDLVCSSSSFSINPLKSLLESIISARVDATWAYSNMFANEGLIRVMGNTLATSLRNINRSRLKTTNGQVDLSYSIKTTTHKCSGDTYSLDSK